MVAPVPYQVRYVLDSIQPIYMSSLKRKALYAARIGKTVYKKPYVRHYTSSSSSSSSAIRRYPLKRKTTSKYAHLSVTRPLRNFGQSLMPRMYRTKFVYTNDNHLLSTGAGASYAYYVFRGNSLYDPDYTGAGRTAIGHAEMATLYYNYKVIQSRITVQFFGSTFTQKGIRCHIYPDLSSADPGTQDVIMSHQVRASGMITEQTPNLQLVHTTKTCSMFGSSTADDYDFAAQFGGNPTLAWFWIVGITSGANDIVKATVTIEYDTICFSNKNTYGSAL